MRIRSALLLAVAVLTMLPTVVRAEATSIAPQFDTADAYGECDRLGYLVSVPSPGRCTADVSANVDGQISSELWARTPREGRGPGSNGATGWSSVSVAHPFTPGMATSLKFTILARVNRAAAFVTGYALAPHGWSEAWLTASVLTQSSAYGWDYREVASHPIVSHIGSNGSASVENEIFEISMTLNRQPGERSAKVEIYVDSSIGTPGSTLPPGVPRGEARLSVDLEILGVSVAPAN